MLVFASVGSSTSFQLKLWPNRADRIGTNPASRARYRQPGAGSSASPAARTAARATSLTAIGIAGQIPHGLTSFGPATTRGITSRSGASVSLD